MTAFPILQVDPSSYSTEDVRLHRVSFDDASMTPYEGEYVLIQDPDSDLVGAGRVHRVRYATREILVAVEWDRSRA